MRSHGVNFVIWSIYLRDAIQVRNCLNIKQIYCLEYVTRCQNVQSNKQQPHFNDIIFKKVKYYAKN